MGGYCSELRLWLLKDPAKLIRYVVLFVCCIIVVVQLTECFGKLRNPPISTHSYYNLNETIEMPAVTLCRDPPYKADVLSEISRGDCSHPKYSTCWTNYPFDEVPLVDFFANATYSHAETFLGQQYGLNGYMDNVDISSSMHFYLGRCYTVRPKVLSRRVNRNAGYSMVLQHHVDPDNSSYDQFESEPGWHIFIHDQRENFTEVYMKSSGRVEYVFAQINEELEIKLQTKLFVNVEKRYKSCSKEDGYSDLKCGELCIWQQLADRANCSAPWMYDVPQPPCENKQSMKVLTSEYSKLYDSELDGDDDADADADCDCVQPCETRLFSTYIQNRKPFNQPEPNSQIYIYYTTKLISMIEERPNYDTTQFIADIGGSLGFLLGLSVLGIIGILEHVILFVCGDFIQRMQARHEAHMRKEADQRSHRSDETVDIATIYNEKVTATA